MRWGEGLKWLCFEQELGFAFVVEYYRAKSECICIEFYESDHFASEFQGTTKIPKLV